MRWDRIGSCSTLIKHVPQDLGPGREELQGVEMDQGFDGTIQSNCSLR